MLRGRDAERERVAALLECARAGQGQVLVVRGEPGTGKSALLDDAVTGAGDLTVLRTQGIESEAPLAFAALQRLLRPVLSLSSRLPAPQAAALRAAFGEEPGGGVDRFLVFLGALSLLTEAAETRPVLVVADDAHWLDDASAAALLFVARRLQLERLSLLFAAREGDVRRFDSGDLPVLELGGLDVATAAELIRARAGGEVTEAVVAQLVAETGGNPLALVELPQVLDEGQLAGRTPLPERLPLTRAVERAFLDRARRLSADAQRLLLVAAVDDTGDVGTVTAAARRLGAGPAALADAERSGLARVSGAALSMRHPLVRSAVYAAAPSGERRQAHAALAEVLTGEADADRRAWHRAASLTEPDEQVVRELEDVARRAEQRGGYEAAAAAWQRAADLSATADRPRRLLGAARAAWLAGRPAGARALADAARTSADDPALRADATRLRARVEWNTGSVPLAHRMLLEGAAAVAPGDPARAREMAMFAAAVASVGGESGVPVSPLDFAGPPDDPDLRQRCLTELVTGFAHAGAGRWKEADRWLRRAFATGESLGVDDQDVLPNLAVAAMHLGDADAAESYHLRLLSRARSSGALVVVLYALTRLGFTDVVRAQWTLLAARQSEAVRLGLGTGQPVLATMPRAWLLLLAALRGDPAYDELVGPVEQALDAGSAGVLDALLRDVTRWAKAMRASPRSAAGFHHLAQMAAGITQRSAGLDRVEAAAHAGQTQVAQLWLAELESFAAETGQVWPAAVAAHGQAVLAGLTGLPSAEADRQFERALGLQGRSARPFELARARLAYGEHLRRTRRRVAARDHLRAALATFDDLRAAPWSDRAVSELRASGETARRRDPSTSADLTPQELQVAQLVQSGLSNREVAAQLFVSPRTVDFHLRNVFAKTGVASRAALTQVSLA